MIIYLQRTLGSTCICKLAFLSSTAGGPGGEQLPHACVLAKRKRASLFMKRNWLNIIIICMSDEVNLCAVAQALSGCSTGAALKKSRKLPQGVKAALNMSAWCTNAAYTICR